MQKLLKPKRTCKSLPMSAIFLGREEGGGGGGLVKSLVFVYSLLPALFVSKSIASISFSQKWLNKVVDLGSMNMREFFVDFSNVFHE